MFYPVWKLQGHYKRTSSSGIRNLDQSGCNTRYKDIGSFEFDFYEFINYRIGFRGIWFQQLFPREFLLLMAGKLYHRNHPKGVIQPVVDEWNSSTTATWVYENVCINFYSYSLWRCVHLFLFLDLKRSYQAGRLLLQRPPWDSRNQRYCGVFSVLFWFPSTAFFVS